MAGIADLITGALSCSRKEAFPIQPALVFTAIALPHALYAFIWFLPHVWMRRFPNNPVDAFATAGAVGKLIQFGAVLAWFSSIRSQGLCIDLSAVSLLQWLLFLVLVCYGQSLNVGIFSAIGHDGVYYGFKLGRKIPWVTGWPFDSVSHPQYVGSVLTIWGFVALVWSQYPSLELLTAAGFWTLVYAVTAVQEQYL